jgi:SAM-dependent methyltransferase
MQPELSEPHLLRRASQLELGTDGIWFARGDVDQAFAGADETDWAEVEERSFWYGHRNQVLLDVLRRFPYGGWLFEIGAGNGAVSRAIQEAGLAVVAVEPTVAWARRARVRGLRHVICAHFEKAGFASGTLDNVGLFDVLEHVQHDHGFLCDLRRLMPAGGRLYLAVPAFQALWSREDELSGHQRRYRIRALTALIEAAGFRAEYATYFFLPLVPAIWAARAVPHKLGIALRRTHASSAADHGINESLRVKLVRAALRLERGILRRGVPMPLGSSLLMVARAG